MRLLLLCGGLRSAWQLLVRLSIAVVGCFFVSVALCWIFDLDSVRSWWTGRVPCWLRICWCLGSLTILRRCWRTLWIAFGMVADKTGSSSASRICRANGFVATFGRIVLPGEKKTAIWVRDTGTAGETYFFRFGIEGFVCLGSVPVWWLESRGEEGCW